VCGSNCRTNNNKSLAIPLIFATQNAGGKGDALLISAFAALSHQGTEMNSE
jgi:hypothetical protein